MVVSYSYIIIITIIIIIKKENATVQDKNTVCMYTHGHRMSLGNCLYLTFTLSVYDNIKTD